jgi:hypothetical protein
LNVVQLCKNFEKISDFLHGFPRGIFFRRG